MFGNKQKCSFFCPSSHNLCIQILQQRTKTWKKEISTSVSSALLPKVVKIYNNILNWNLSRFVTSFSVLLVLNHLLQDFDFIPHVRHVRFNLVLLMLHSAAPEKSKASPSLNMILCEFFNTICNIFLIRSCGLMDTDNLFFWSWWTQVQIPPQALFI